MSTHTGESGPLVTVAAWLAEPWHGQLPFEYGSGLLRLPDGVTPQRSHVLTALIYMNGSITVRGWGFTKSGGLYGRHGLCEREAITLLQAGSYLLGLIDATGDTTTLARVMAEEQLRVAAALRAGPDPTLAPNETT